jgi:nucleotide-binding universal stress UspA family protein
MYERIAHVQRLALAVGARVTLLHVIETIGDEPGDSELEDFYGGLRARAGENMRALAQRFDEAGLEWRWDIRVGIRWRTILAVADDEDSDLIVMGSRAVLDQAQPHLGSTSHQVFFASKRPLLVIRS